MTSNPESTKKATCATRIEPGPPAEVSTGSITGSDDDSADPSNKKHFARKVDQIWAACDQNDAAAKALETLFSKCLPKPDRKVKFEQHTSMLAQHCKHYLSEIDAMQQPSNECLQFAATLLSNTTTALQLLQMNSQVHDLQSDDLQLLQWAGKASFAVEVGANPQADPTGIDDTHSGDSTKPTNDDVSSCSKRKSSDDGAQGQSKRARCSNVCPPSSSGSNWLDTNTVVTASNSKRKADTTVLHGQPLKRQKLLEYKTNLTSFVGQDYTKHTNDDDDDDRFANRQRENNTTVPGKDDDADNMFPIRQEEDNGFPTRQEEDNAIVPYKGDNSLDEPDRELNTELETSRPSCTELVLYVPPEERTRRCGLSILDEFATKLAQELLTSRPFCTALVLYVTQEEQNRRLGLSRELVVVGEIVDGISEPWYAYLLWYRKTVGRFRRGFDKAIVDPVIKDVAWRKIFKSGTPWAGGAGKKNPNTGRCSFYDTRPNWEKGLGYLCYGKGKGQGKRKRIVANVAVARKFFREYVRANDGVEENEPLLEDLWRKATAGLMKAKKAEQA